MKTVVQALPVASIGYAAAYVAQANGYYRDAGLDVQTPTMSSDAAVAGLLSGDVTFAVAGSGLRASMRGAPLTVIIYSYNTTLFELMASPSIQSVQDLRGKAIGTSSRGSSEETLTNVFLRKAGVDPSEATYVVVGSGQQLPGLLAGSIQAMMLNPDLAAEARQGGMHDLVDLQTVGQAVPEPFAGFVVATKTLQTQPDLVLAWLKAYVRALQSMHDDPAAAADVISQALNFDPSLSREALLDAVSAINPDDYGGFTEEGFQLQVQDNLGQMGADATVTRVSDLVDLTLLRQAQRELGVPCRTGYQCT